METFLDIAVQGLIPDYRPSPENPRKDRQTVPDEARSSLNN
jgi:hypothetical protein